MNYHFFGLAYIKVTLKYVFVLTALFALASCSNSNSSNSSSTVTTLDPVIHSFVASTTSITSGASVTLTAIFENGSGEIDNAVGTVTSGIGVQIKPTVTTTYTLLVQNDSGTSKTATLTVNVSTVLGIPSISSFSANPSNIVSGESTNLLAVFANGTGLIDQNVGNITSNTAIPVSPVSTTTYILTVKNSAGETATSSVTVTVAPPAIKPLINAFSVSPIIINFGESANLTMSFKNGTGTIDNAIGSVNSGDIKSVSPTSNTTYTLTVSDGKTSISQSVFLTVITQPSAPAPIIHNFLPVIPVISRGESNGLAVSFENGNGSINNGIGPVISGDVIPITPSGERYILTVTNDAGDSTVASITPYVDEAPVINSFNAASVTINKGESTTLTANFINETIASINNDVGTVQSGVPVVVSPTRSTTYKLTVSRTLFNGTKRSINKSIYVVVNTPPSILEFEADPPWVEAETPTQIGWHWKYSTPPSPQATCSVDQGIGEISNGTLSTVSISTDRVYTLTCTSTSGTDSRQLTISSTPVNTAPDLISAEVTPKIVNPNHNTPVTWSWKFSSPPWPKPTCTVDQGVAALSDYDVTNISIASTTTYNLTCQNNVGTSSKTIRLAVRDPLTIESIATGFAASHTCAISADNRVSCWGNNHAGQLGDGTTLDSPSPVNVQGISEEVMSITAGNNFTCALLISNKVMCWGDNTYLNLGYKGVERSLQASLVPGLPNAILSITAGSGHVCALADGGAVYCWGNNIFGAATGTNNYVLPTQKTELTLPAIQISAGANHTCALLEDRSVSCWGDNRAEQLGLSSLTQSTSTPNPVVALSNIAKVAAGNTHTCSLSVSGSVSCWGERSSYILGVSGIGTTATPVTTPLDLAAINLSSGFDHSCAILESGEAQCWGVNINGQLGVQTEWRSPPIAIANSNFTEIAAGSMLSCGKNSSGNILCWGINDKGQAGIGHNSNKYTPVKVPLPSSADIDKIFAGFENTCVLQAGIATCWGSNVAGELGTGTLFLEPKPVAVTFSQSIIDIKIDRANTCIILSPSGGVNCWGDYPVTSSFGKLTPEPITGLESGINQIVGRDKLVFAITNDGSLYCFGASNNRCGSAFSVTTPQLVTGLDPGVATVATGEKHACALLTDGSVKCWGSANQLGSGEAVPFVEYTPVSALTLGSGIVNLSAGANHTCAVRDSGKVTCWGTNYYGQLGIGINSTNSLSSLNYLFPLNVQNLSDAISVSSGLNFSCALRQSGQVACWGENRYGQLGDGTEINSNTPVPVALQGKAVAIVAGDNHACAKLADTSLQCWGDDSSGQVSANFEIAPQAVLPF